MATAIAVGIDVGLLARKGLHVVALDEHRRIIRKVSHLRSLDELTRIVDGLGAAVVCIDSPSQWAEPGVRRAAELDLGRRGINLYATPSPDRVRPFHYWMRDGFTVYLALAPRYPRYRGGDVRGTAAEYYPHGAAVALAGHIPPFAEKQAFRRQLLTTHEVDASALVGPDQVDAALGALTGLIALEGAHTWVGDGDESMLLPVRNLPARFCRIHSPAQDTPAPAPTPRQRRARPSSDRAPCLCGCGRTPTGSRSRFMPGHDHRINPATGRRWNGLP